MNDPKSDIVKAHQAVHGYRDGHELIDCSIKLSNNSRRMMLVLSDMSGPSMTNGFETYLTAYPLIEDNYYVVARTWYAPEMNRPGCVWTHSLLIEFADVARIPSLEVLNHFFIRPDPSSHAQYDKPVPIDRFDIDFSEHLSQQSLQESAKFLMGLYQQPSSPMIVPAQKVDQYESLILKIWSQQWPRLRRHFAFCSGAISSRSVASNIFDLQVVPAQRLRQIRRDMPDRTVIVDDNMLAIDLDWLFDAIEDLYASSKTAYREFLWTYAIDTKGGRDTFMRLSDIYAQLRHRRHTKNSIKMLMNSVALNFSSPSEGILIKQALFGGKTERSEFLLKDVADESFILQHLVTLKESSAFDPESLSIYERAYKLWRFDRDSARAILIELLHQDISLLGEMFVRGISEAMDAEDAIELAHERPGLLAVFVRLNPIIAASPKTWKSRDIDRRELVEALALSESLDAEMMSKIIPTLLREANDNIADDVLKQLGEQAIDFILQEMGSLQSWQLRIWRHALKKQPELILSYLRRSMGDMIAATSTAVSLLDPDSDVIGKLSSNEWLWAVQLGDKDIPHGTAIELRSFLLAVAFRNSSEGFDRLASASFETVHDAAANDDLPYDCWMLIERVLPTLSMWRYWDRCERLRRGLVNKFDEFDWSTQEFLNCLKSEHLFEKVIESARATSAGSRFLRRVKEDLTHGRLEALTFQDRILTNKKR